MRWERSSRSSHRPQRCATSWRVALRDRVSAGPGRSGDRGRDRAIYRAHLDRAATRPAWPRCAARCARGPARAALPALAERLDRDALTEPLLASLRFRAFDDVRPALRSACASTRFVSWSCSNWDVSLHEVLARLELRPLLDGIADLGGGGGAQAGAGDLRAGTRAGRGRCRRCGSPRRQRGGGRRGGAGERGSRHLVRRGDGPMPPGIEIVTTLMRAGCPLGVRLRPNLTLADAEHSAARKPSPSQPAPDRVPARR